MISTKPLLLAVLSVAATLALHALPLARPVLWQDDFQILAHSTTWEATRQHLLRPHNEHVMPLGRLSTCLLVQLAARPSHLPVLAAWHGPLAVLVGLGLLFVFVRRELGHVRYALVALALFGVTTQYREAVWWFSASFGLLALDTVLLALLAAQAWRQTGRGRYLAACAVAAALAPCWFASGILAGPVCCLYLLPWQRDGLAAWRRGLRALVPLLGTAVFAATGLLRNVDEINHLEHWGDKTAVQAFQPLTGLLTTARSLVDNLLLGNLGISGVQLPLPVSLAVLLPLSVAAWSWWRHAGQPRLLAVGLALVLLSYWLIYSARAEWSYAQVSSWGRYQLFAHLGLVLFVVGGLPRWSGTAELSWRRCLILAGCVVLLFLVQLPRGLSVLSLPDQAEDFRRLDRVDALCREQRIAAATARQVLPPFAIAGCGLRADGTPRVNGWEFLRGSDEPLPFAPAEASGLLQE